MHERLPIINIGHRTYTEEQILQLSSKHTIALAKVIWRPKNGTSHINGDLQSLRPGEAALLKKLFWCGVEISIQSVGKKKIRIVHW